jgi:PAS domain S-box-containing protein
MLAAVSGLEHALRRLSGDLYSALDRLRIPAGLIDTSGTIVYANRAAVDEFGRVRGRKLTSLVAPESQSSVRDALARKLVGSEVATELDANVIVKDGRTVPAEISSVAVEDHGHVVGVFGLVRVLSPAPRPQRSSPRTALTPRQAEVLHYLAAGYTTAQIAQVMGITVHTVRNHVRDLLMRLDARTRLEAVVKGHEQGLV